MNAMIKDRLDTLRNDLEQLRQEHKSTINNLIASELVIKALLKHFGLVAKEQDGYVIEVTTNDGLDELRKKVAESTERQI